jgi:hypothetical protein
LRKIEGIAPDAVWGLASVEWVKNIMAFSGLQLGREEAAFGHRPVRAVVAGLPDI